MKTFFQLREQAGQVTVGDYTTKHFDICPSAVKLYSNIKNMTPMVHLVVENMMLHDLFFRLEKQAIAQGSIDMDDLEKADHYAEMIMDNAEQMGLEEEHSYIEDVHMAKFEQLAGMSDDEEEDDESEMNEKTLTKAELKKREEVAKAIERENPNMPMAKKMAIATATAKKVAEEAELGEATVQKWDNVKVNKPGDQHHGHKGVINRSKFGAHTVTFKNGKTSVYDSAELVKEDLDEAEQIDEISRDLARRYIRKATADNKERRSEVMKPFNSKDMAKNVSQYKKMKSREKGIETAGKKAYDIGGKAKVPARESVELDEVSDKKLDAYRQKAFADQPSGDDGSDKYRKRKFGRDLAFAKQTGRAKVLATKEEFEQIDEISKKTLGSYIKKASGNMAGNAAVAAAQASSSMKKSSPDVKRNIKNRMTGITKATDKLTKEEVELDEVSQAMKDRYIQKSMSSHGHNAAVASDAKSRGDQATYDKARKIMKKRNQGMTRAFGGERA